MPKPKEGGNLRRQESSLKGADKNAAGHQAAKALCRRRGCRCNAERDHHSWQTILGCDLLGNQAERWAENNEDNVVECQDQVVLVSMQSEVGLKSCCDCVSKITPVKRAERFKLVMRFRQLLCDALEQVHYCQHG